MVFIRHTQIGTTTTFLLSNFPLPINHTSKHATQLILLPYLAITPQLDLYVTLTNDDLSSCKRNTFYVCKNNLPLIPASVLSYSIALFTNNVQLIKKHCDYRFLLDFLAYTITELTPTTALVYLSQKYLTVHCPDHQETVPACSYCVQMLSNITNLILPPRLVDCFSSASLFNTDTSTVNHPVNIALRSYHISSLEKD